MSLVAQTHDKVASSYANTLSFFSSSLTGDGWRIKDWDDRRLQWRFFDLPEGAESPSQGWKLHVSAAAAESPRMLRAVVAVLARLRIPFKLPRCVEGVVFINSGDAGAEQLGKILTVYPPDRRVAGLAIAALDAAWPQSQGPEVLTDLRPRIGAAVSFRYGAFRARDEVVSSTGTHETALRREDGSLFADRRPALEAGVEAPCEVALPSEVRIIASRPLTVGGVDMLPLMTLGRTARASTWLAVRLDRLDTVVLKEGRPGAAGDAVGRDIQHLMRNEYAALKALEGEQHLAPSPLWFVDERRPLLAMSDRRGPLLGELPHGERTAALPLLAEAVARLHAAGWVHGDIKLDNAVLHDSGVTLIDFELAARIGEPMRSGGTPGYLAPEVEGRSIPATIARDVFALGGCVAHVLLDVPPGLLPEGCAAALLRNEGLHEAAACVSVWCAGEPLARPDATSVAATLRERVPYWTRGNTLLADDCALEPWSRRAALEAVIASTRYLRQREQGACWANDHFMRDHDCEGINLGAAGIILGLLAIGRLPGFVLPPAVEASMDAGACWLASRGAAGKAAGAYTGNAGVALALAAAGKCRSDDRLLTAARVRFEAAVCDEREIDLFSGKAGVIWTATLLHALLDDAWPLEAVEAGIGRLMGMRRLEQGVPVWGTDGDTTFYGAAHGSAGIALALAAWGRAAGVPAAIDEARETWRAIVRHACTADGRALRIGPRENRHHAVGNWCHGVAGLLWTMLNGVGDDPSLRGEIDWAVASLAVAPATGTATWCHGLAGQLELWQMLRTVPRHARLAHERARCCARALQCLQLQHDVGQVWASDDPSIVTPDLWIGFLGPATALALFSANVQDAMFSPATFFRW